jgi:NAD+ diphosphatase
MSIVTKHPDLGPPPRLGYTPSLIDRVAMMRGNGAAIKKFREDPRAGVYVTGGEFVVLKAAIFKDMVLKDMVLKDMGEQCDPLFSPAEVYALGATGESVFLGVANDAPRFGFALEPETIERLKARADLKITDLRTVAVQGLVGAEHLPPLAEAKALLNWHARHRFCPNCGAPTKVVQAGWRRDCPACGMQHFPRTDPVVIMLAISGERCVLGRSRRFAPTMWSCLAGFAEPGESIEEAVRREVLEEAGIACGRVSYFASQPWPFPSSIMIGCHAQALSEDLVIDREELEDARWFSRDECAAMLARRHPQGLTTPPPIAIAHHIIRSFVEDGCNVIR